MTENVITIDGKEYKPEDMDEKQTYLIAQLRACQQKAANIRFELDQVQAAQNVFTNELIKSVQLKGRNRGSVMAYLGKTPSQATRRRYYKTASGGETSLSGTMTTGGTLTFSDGEFVDVSVNGVALVAGTDYNTTTANTIGGLSALSASDQVEIIVYDTFSVFGGNVNGDFTVSNGTLQVQAAMCRLMVVAPSGRQLSDGHEQR